MADELTGDQIEKLAEAISLRVWTSIALAHFGIEQPEIDDLNRENPREPKAVSRALITQWANKSFDEVNLVKKLAGILYSKAERTGEVNGRKVKEILGVSRQDSATATQKPSGASAGGGGQQATSASSAGPELTAIMMHNLSRKITSEAELRNLATLGLRVKSDITDTNLTNVRDINNAALRVIEEWALNKQDKRAAYVELCEILKNISRSAYINVLVDGPVN